MTGSAPINTHCQSVAHTHWHRLPHFYDDTLSNVSLLATQAPFQIATCGICADKAASVHWHDAFEIGYVLEGTGIFVHEGREKLFSPDQVHIINGSDRHMAYASERARFFNVHFHPAILHDGSFRSLSEAAQRCFQPETYRFQPFLPGEHEGTAQIITLLRHIAAEHQAAMAGWQLMVKGLILQITGVLLRHFAASPVADAHDRHLAAIRARLAPALALIEQRLTEALSIADMAAVIAVSPSHFSMLFKAAIGSAPLTYRNARRIIMAQRMLVATTLPIDQIASTCGFLAVQQFNRLFRRQVGCTPNAYRCSASANRFSAP